MAKKPVSLGIEIKDGSTDCGYSICFTADENTDFNSKSFDQWRADVTAAVFDAGGQVFGATRAQILRKLTDDFDGINAVYNDFQIRSVNGVPALQIDSVDGRRLEVEFNGTFDDARDVTFSRNTLAVPRMVQGQGNGGIGMAVKGEFPFPSGTITPYSAPAAKIRRI